MPITFSITIDADDELAKFLEGIQSGKAVTVSAPKNATVKTSAQTATKPGRKPAAPKAVKKATAAAPKAKTAKAAAKPVAKKVTKVKAVKPAKAAKVAKAPKAVKAVKAVKAAKPAVKPAAKKVATKAITKAAAPKAAKKPAAPKAPRKQGKLVPLIQNAIAEVVKRGQSFRTKDVTTVVMKKDPKLNESSVVTGVSKLLAESPLKYEQIKDAVGRPYKLYKP